MDIFLKQFFNLAIAERVLPSLLHGLQMTILLALITVPLGLMVGLAIAALQELHNRFLNGLLVVYIDALRAFPPLVLLVFLYYGMPFLGLELSSMQAVCTALILNTSSYYAEVFRAGIESVPRGQIEAARSTGLGMSATLRYVVVPQAVRNVLPDLMSNILEAIKLTSLASVVTLPELLRVARIAQGNMFNTTPLIVAALLYLLMLWPLVRLITVLERRSLSRQPRV